MSSISSPRNAEQIEAHIFIDFELTDAANSDATELKQLLLDAIKDVVCSFKDVLSIIEMDDGLNSTVEEPPLKRARTN